MNAPVKLPTVAWRRLGIRVVIAVGVGIAAAAAMVSLGWIEASAGHRNQQGLVAIVITVIVNRLIERSWPLVPAHQNAGSAPVDDPTRRG